MSKKKKLSILICITVLMTIFTTACSFRSNWIKVVHLSENKINKLFEVIEEPDQRGPLYKYACDSKYITATLKHKHNGTWSIIQVKSLRVNPEGYIYIEGVPETGIKISTQPIKTVNRTGEDIYEESSERFVATEFETLKVYSNTNGKLSLEKEEPIVLFSENDIETDSDVELIQQAGNGDFAIFVQSELEITRK